MKSRSIIFILSVRHIKHYYRIELNFVEKKAKKSETRPLKILNMKLKLFKASFQIPSDSI